MSTNLNAYDLDGRTVYTSDGEKLGTVEEILVDDTDVPQYVRVRGGFLGMKQRVVPVTGASLAGDELTVTSTKAQLEAAPEFDEGAAVDYDTERTLSGHYGHDVRDWDDERDAVGHDTSGPTTDDAMTRSEEELRVGTTSHEAGRVRLRKWIETEPVSETVTTRRETARVEREPITEANIDRATAGPELSEEEHEVTLMEEDAVAEKRVVPKERVRLETDTVTEQQTVSDELRKERIEVEGDVEDVSGR